MTKLTIFITSYNRNEMLQNLVKQISEQTYNKYEYKVENIRA